MDDGKSQVQQLPPDEALRRLSSAPVARVACTVGERIEIFPVNVAMADDKLYLLSGAGTKLSAIAIAHRVAIEADDVDPAARQAWSVVVHGEANIVDSFDAQYRLEETVDLHPWQPQGKTVWVEVAVDEVDGRVFGQG